MVNARVGTWARFQFYLSTILTCSVTAVSKLRALAMEIKEILAKEGFFPNYYQKLGHERIFPFLLNFLNPACPFEVII